LDKRSCPMVVRSQVLTLFSVENDLSGVAEEVAIVATMLSSFSTSDTIPLTRSGALNCQDYLHHAHGLWAKLGQISQVTAQSVDV